MTISNTLKASAKSSDYLSDFDAAERFSPIYTIYIRLKLYK